MKKTIQDCLEGIGQRDWVFCVSLVSDVLYFALKNGVKELSMDKAEYDIMTSYMIYVGGWDWDKYTFMGIKFVIR